MEPTFRSTDEIDRILADTFSDFALSRGEKGALRAILKGRTANELAVWRSRVFCAAKKFAQDRAESDLLLSWLEEMIKVLIPQSQAESTAKVWFSPREDCAAAISGLIGRTLKSMDLCVFTITDDRLTDAIIHAHQRGVRIRVMTDNEKSYDEGSDAWRLAHAGISVFIDTSPFHMHHKFGIFDGRTILTGSYNWTRSASRDNEENLVILDDRKLVDRFQQEFEFLIDQPGTRPMISTRK